MRATGHYRATRRRHTDWRHIEGDHYLAPALTVAALTGTSVTSVRKFCEPVACDVPNRALLYDYVSSEEALKSRGFQLPGDRASLAG